MNYTKFTIKNFRCFTEEQTLQLAKPINGKIGSGITYIVGANNSGKTTIIESLWIKKDHFLNDSEKKEGFSPIFKLYDGDNLMRMVDLISSSAFRFKELPERANNNNLFEVISSRRQWESVTNNDNSSENVIISSALGNNPRKQQNFETAEILKDIEKSPERYKDFTNLVKKITPEFTSWAIGFENQPYVKYISSDKSSHKADFLGDGVISVIRILVHLFEKRACGLIIDEPELSLHPLAQKNLRKLIAEYSQERQIIISTHSPYFVDWKYIENGAKLNRVAKIGDTNSKIYTLKESGNYTGLINGANWQQPFLMDEVAKEIFFADDNILFLEGQEDVGLLRNELSKLNIHFFGYGVRGCDNFRIALTMASDLGFKKVGVVLDKGGKEDQIYSDLIGTFSGYKIIQWNKNDIRDKEAITSLEKQGYFTSEGKIKPEDELDDFSAKINDIKEYFK